MNKNNSKCWIKKDEIIKKYKYLDDFIQRKNNKRNKMK